MEKSYNVCGLKVRADFRHDFMTSRSEKYLCADDTADILLPYDEARINSLMERGCASIHSAENIVTADAFYTALLGFDGFMLHSSAVAVDGRAYLFSAPSGTGKSTHTGLWLRLFGERAQIINDDKPALRFIGSEVIAYGTPWSGKSDLNVNIGVPVGGICVLERSETNFIELLDEATAVYSILNQTIRPSRPELMSCLLEYVDRLIRTVPIWRMGCNISTEAAQIAYDAMSKRIKP